MSYLADPGGVFASDTHRRALGHLPLPGDDPTELHPLGYRISADAHHELQTVDDLEEVLKDLEADGHATKLKDGWKQTKAGHEALSAPLPEGHQETAGPALLGGLETGGNSRG